MNVRLGGSRKLFLVVAVFILIANQLEMARAIEESKDTYFGVDANDKDAVRAKQHELAAEKWKEMMGDVKIEDINFDDLEIMPRVDAFFKKLHDMLFKPEVTVKPDVDH